MLFGKIFSITTHKSVRAIIFAACFLMTVAHATSVEELFQRPGVIGDSLSQGFYGVGVQKKTQDWAYPVLVAKQVGAELKYNTLSGPSFNIEDVVKQQCSPGCVAKGLKGVLIAKVHLPSHAGVSGADYTTALKMSGKCADIERAPICLPPDDFHRLALGGAGTQVQIMEKLKPTFLFGSIAANHVLCAAIQTSVNCLDMQRFKRDFAEVMRRMKAMGSLRGGVLFTVPNVTSIPLLEFYRDPLGRKAYTGYKLRMNNIITSPNQILDVDEIKVIKKFTVEMNEAIRQEGGAAGFAVADLETVFDNIQVGGRQITSLNGKKSVIAYAHWPMPGRAGLFALDGVHPNMLGHSVIANEIIRAINYRYRLEIKPISEYLAWENDSLNQEPIDVQRMKNPILVAEIMQSLSRLYFAR